MSRIDPTAGIAPTAVVIDDVRIGATPPDAESAHDDSA